MSNVKRDTVGGSDTESGGLASYAAHFFLDRKYIVCIVCRCINKLCGSRITDGKLSLEKGRCNALIFNGDFYSGIKKRILSARSEIVGMLHGAVDVIDASVLLLFSAFCSFLFNRFKYFLRIYRFTV